MHPLFVQSLARKGAELARTLDHAPIIGRVIAGDASPDEYASFLIGSYQYVCRSSLLLTATSKGLRRRGRYEALADLLMVKAVEEAPHDRWILNDAEQCGIDPDDVRNSATCLAVGAYIAWSEALAAAGSAAYLGAAYMLESIAVHRAGVAAKSLRARAAIPHIERAVTFLNGHSEADVGHIDTLASTLSVVDDPRDQAEIVTSADVLATLYPRFFVAS